MVQLSEIIIQRIHDEGPVSFHDFMEMALYYPTLGYYTSDTNKIGRDGDYLTSSDYTSLFGEMIGKQIEEIWMQLESHPITVLECGAGTGSLCHDILHCLKNNSRLYDKLNYYIVEKSNVMREKEKALLNEKVTWYESIQDIPEITGCILSNELIDNFSVHRVIMEDELMEIFVNYDKGFVELLQPASAELKDYLEQLNIQLPKGFCTEINLETIDWIKDISDALKKGYLITIDYGYSASELYHQSRNKGTLVCYNKHNTNTNFYDQIGEQDITAHVNFSALNHWGQQCGLKYCGFTDQAGFLHSLGVVNYLRESEVKMKNNSDNANANALGIYPLLMSMGSKFKILIQQKGVQQLPLSCLQFSQPFV
jgi:SAM-dependent MidA family methyltransferase